MGIQDYIKNLRRTIKTQTFALEYKWWLYMYSLENVCSDSVGAIWGSTIAEQWSRVSDFNVSATFSVIHEMISKTSGAPRSHNPMNVLRSALNLRNTVHRISTPFHVLWLVDRATRETSNKRFRLFVIWIATWQLESDFKVQSFDSLKH